MVSEDGRKWWVLGAMGAILGVILLDETVVGVALPTIQRDLALSEIDSHWVVNIYMLVLAGLAAAAGKLGDIVGHKALVSVGLAIFGLTDPTQRWRLTRRPAPAWVSDQQAGSSKWQDWHTIRTSGRSLAPTSNWSVRRTVRGTPSAFWD